MATKPKAKVSPTVEVPVDPQYVSKNGNLVKYGNFVSPMVVAAKGQKIVELPNVGLTVTLKDGVPAQNLMFKYLKAGYSLQVDGITVPIQWNNPDGSSGSKYSQEDADIDAELLAMEEPGFDDGSSEPDTPEVPGNGAAPFSADVGAQLLALLQGQAKA